MKPADQQDPPQSPKGQGKGRRSPHAGGTTFPQRRRPWLQRPGTPFRSSTPAALLWPIIARASAWNWSPCCRGSDKWVDFTLRGHGTSSLAASVERRPDLLGVQRRLDAGGIDLPLPEMPSLLLRQCEQ